MVKYKGAGMERIRVRILRMARKTAITGVIRAWYARLGKAIRSRILHRIRLVRLTRLQEVAQRKKVAVFRTAV